MAFKKYLTADNVHAQLDGNVNTTQTQIVFKNGANVPTAGNWIATLVQYGQDGFPSKWEKVLVT
jgi:pentose-5-phosphate-3-epimerase